MLDNNLIPLIQETSRKLGLQAYTIEKDVYTSLAIQLFSQVKNDYFNLIFSGGTCLAKCHRVIERMSEDIDFKIAIKPDAVASFSKTRLTKELKLFRQQILQTLEGTPFAFDPEGLKASNSGRYFKLELNYPSIFDKQPILRDHLLIEWTVSEVKREHIHLSPLSLIEMGLGQSAIQGTLLEQLKQPVACISIEETAAEKWVAFTRRVSTLTKLSPENNAYEEGFLVRHLYDLYFTLKESTQTEEFLNLITQIIQDDSHQFKNQNTDYYKNPSEEIKHVFEQLKENEKWTRDYGYFIQQMVYNPSIAPTYEVALDHIEKMKEPVIAKLTLLDALSLQETTEKKWEDLLIDYTSLRMEQTQLTQSMHYVNTKTREELKVIEQQVFQHAQRLENYALQLANHPDLQNELKKLEENRTHPTLSIAKQGGMAAIQERLKQNKAYPEDIQTLAYEIQKAVSQSKQKSLQQTQDTHQGGGRKR